MMVETVVDHVLKILVVKEFYSECQARRNRKDSRDISRCFLGKCIQNFNLKLLNLTASVTIIPVSLYIPVPLKTIRRA